MYVRGKKMIEKNTRICNLMKRIINVITAVMAVVIAQIISENFLDGSLLWTVIIMVVWSICSTVNQLSIYYSHSLKILICRFLHTHIITVPYILYNENLFSKSIFSVVPAVHGFVDCLRSGCLYSSTQYPLPLHTSPHLHPYRSFVIPYRLLD